MAVNPPSQRLQGQLRSRTAMRDALFFYRPCGAPYVPPSSSSSLSSPSHHGPGGQVGEHPVHHGLCDSQQFTVDDSEQPAIALLLALNLGRVVAELPERGARRRERSTAEDFLFRDVERGASSLRCGSHHGQQEQAGERHCHVCRAGRRGSRVSPELSTQTERNTIHRQLNN